MFRKTFYVLGVAFILAFVLFIDSQIFKQYAFVRTAISKLNILIYDPHFQWMVLAVISVYYSTFVLDRWLSTDLTRKDDIRSPHALWLSIALFVGMWFHIHSFPLYSNDIQPFVLFCGATLGHGVSTYVSRIARFKSDIVLKIFFILLCLSLTLSWHLNDTSFVRFYYCNHARWTGPWYNPNIFGLLMGVGLVIGIGQALVLAFNERQYPSSKKMFASYFKIHDLLNWTFTLICLFFITAMLMSRGLLYSYSRGAWLAAGCGLAFLIGSWVRQPGLGGHQLSTIDDRRSAKERLVLRSLLPLVAIVAAAAVIYLWHFRQSDWRPVRRVLSAVNAADFSSRNRIAAWVSDLQIMAEHPWFGAGWNQPEPLYEHYYLSPHLSERAAIETNEYLLLGATIGIPAFFCFCMYLWMSLTRKLKSGKPELELTNEYWLRTTSRAGVIVLLVGFWFDGGLFVLPTASTFWILLELGNVGDRGSRELSQNA